MLQEYRSLPILIFYLSLASALAGHACLTIYYRYQTCKTNVQWQRKHSHKLVLFILLACASLASTWFYMFAFFAHSYRSWRSQCTLAQLHELERASLPMKGELWLRDTKLFKQAWETVSETPERHWWSGQIFMFTIAWSIFLGVMGRRFNIPRVWTYMLLGQVVAISFAQSLFAATVVVSLPRQSRSPPQQPATASRSDDHSRESKTLWVPPALLELGPVLISLLSAAVVPLVAHTSYFMPMLLIPHLLLFVPGILSPGMLPRGWGKSQPVAVVARRYAMVFKWLSTILVVLVAQSTYALAVTAEGALWRRLLSAMSEHPAVSSVSWDVVCCFLVVVSWTAAHLGGVSEML
ncbi:hypothetical protein CNMCM6457_000491 [Aspergillus fumigatiaffinis]|nr:hypothetical protein CNMCM6457_000491 [Aspergillus fumigatiaffinis]